MVVSFTIVRGFLMECVPHSGNGVTSASVTSLTLPASSSLGCALVSTSSTDDGVFGAADGERPPRPADSPHNGEVTDRDPLELRVLGALTSGVESPSTVATKVGATREDVAERLERGLLEGLVTRLDLAGTPVYSLTPKGREVVGAGPSVQEVVKEHPQVDALAPTPMVVSEPEAAGEPAEGAADENVVHERTQSDVTWRHVVYALAYVVLGLFFLVFLHTWIGLLAVVAGLVIGFVALRPLLRADDTGVRAR
jgi:hypothetical protein